jgi:hypothetical protein
LSYFVALHLEKPRNLLKHTSLCIFLMSKELWSCSMVLYCGTLQSMYLDNSTVTCTELSNTNSTSLVHGKITCFKMLAVVEFRIVNSVSTG